MKAELPAQTTGITSFVLTVTSPRILNRDSNTMGLSTPAGSLVHLDGSENIEAGFEALAAYWRTHARVTTTTSEIPIRDMTFASSTPLNEAVVVSNSDHGRHLKYAVTSAKLTEKVEGNGAGFCQTASSTPSENQRAIWFEPLMEVRFQVVLETNDPVDVTSMELDVPGWSTDMFFNREGGLRVSELEMVGTSTRYNPICRFDPNITPSLPLYGVTLTKTLTAVRSKSPSSE